MIKNETDVTILNEEKQERKKLNRRGLFVNEYVANLIAPPEKKLNQTQIALRCGYAPATATMQTTRLLRNAKIRAEIDAKVARITAKVEWTMERSLRESLLEYERLKEENPHTSFKHKELLDRLSGHLVDRSLNFNANVDLTETRDARDAITVAREALNRLKRSPDGEPVALSQNVENEQKTPSEGQNESKPPE